MFTFFQHLDGELTCMDKMSPHLRAGYGHVRATDMCGHRHVRATDIRGRYISQQNANLLPVIQNDSRCRHRYGKSRFGGASVGSTERQS